jgi:peptidyl-dipeptidase Dcp
MIRSALGVLLLTALMPACSQDDADTQVVKTAETSGTAGAEVAPAGNPLLAEWNTPFGVPPFDRIDGSHYLPAIRAGIAEHRKEIAAITGLADAPDFANTVEALERSGAALSRVSRVFSAVNAANSNDVTRQTAKVVAPELAAHQDDIFLNGDLFERVDAVHRARDSLDLTAEQRRLLEETHKDFVRSGINLDEPAQARLREINAELATLNESFRENLLNDTNSFVLLVEDEADLGDLPTSLVALAADEAKRRGHDCECWAFTLQRPSIDPFLQYSPNRELRRRIFQAYAMLGNNGDKNDNNAAAGRMAQLRAERAALLGFETHAHYVLSDRMAETPQLVSELLDRVWVPAMKTATEERDARQKMMQADGIEGRLEAWDWRYYSEKLRKANYDYDEEALRAYFEVTAVRDGVFALANRLFGLTFERREDLPVWHPDQQAFEVKDADGSHLAVLYMDFFARESKRSGGWMNALRQQSKMGGTVTPVVTNNFNFPAPAANEPSLLSLSEAETLFHEFGHALHGMLSDVTYESLAGTSTPRDFVEFPSQVMENWMTEPEVLAMFARHYRTGEAIPEEIVEKITASTKFDQGFKTVEYLAASYLDMAYHTLDSPEVVATGAFEDAAMADIGMLDEIIPRYRSTYFAHIFAGGYSAGYYSYLWSEVLDADAFQAFKESSLFDADTAARFREHILSKGGTRPGMELYENFRGRAPQIEPLLERRGFL